MSAAERPLEMAQRPAEEKQARPGIDWRGRLLDRAPFLVACLMLALIVAIYGSLQSGVFTLDELQPRHGGGAALSAGGDGSNRSPSCSRGIDLSIGGMISLGTVIAATRFTDDPSTTALWALIILALGFAIGALNGLLISLLRLQPFLVTLATWSILNGVAMIILPTDGGSVPGWWVGFASAQLLGLTSPVWLLLALLLFWWWFRATRVGIAIQATGSNEKSAFLSGVSITRVNIVTYGLSGLFAAGAALSSVTQTGAGSPTIGKDYILPSVAAAVIGGVSLFGGRGHLAGTLIGAFVLTLIGNLVFVLHVSSYWQPVASGVILLLSVLARSVAEKAARNRAQ